MGVAKRLIDGMAKKSADHIEKFVRRVLDMSISHWGSAANSYFREAHVAGRSFARDEDTSEEVQAYYASFRHWHSLRQAQLGLKDWLERREDGSYRRLLPEEDEAFLCDLRGHEWRTDCNRCRFCRKKNEVD